MMRLLYYCGLRRQELLDLVVADIDWHENLLFIRAGKGDRDRYVLVDPTTIQLLKDWVSGSSAHSPVFLLSPFWSDNHFGKYCLESGLYQIYQQRGLRLSVQSMRHAFATHRFEKKMAFCTLMLLLGVQNAETTAVYLRTANQQTLAADLGPTDSVYSDQDLLPDAAEVEERAKEFVNQPQASRPGGLPSFPNQAEIAQLFEISANNPQQCLLYQLLYATGMSLPAILSLEWDQVFWSNAQIVLPQNGTLVQLEERTMAMLNSWHLEQPEQMFSFPLEHANPIFLNYAQQIRFSQRLEAQDRVAHIDTLRYAFAHKCCLQEMEQVPLLSLLGLKYPYSSEPYLRSAVQRYRLSYQSTQCQQTEPGSPPSKWS
jgi:integrase/recombinase XerD